MILLDVYALIKILSKYNGSGNTPAVEDAAYLGGEDTLQLYQSLRGSLIEIVKEKLKNEGGNRHVVDQEE
jgi:hypothetical protein